MPARSADRPILPDSRCLCAAPLAIGGYLLGRWLPIALALVGLRLGIHAGDLTALRVWDFYEERAQSFDDLTVVYMSARLGFGCLWMTLLASIGYWGGGRIELRLQAAGA